MAVKSSSVAALSGNVLAVILLTVPAPISAQTGGRFGGMDSCRPCHPAQVAGHAKTGHSRALSPTTQHPLRPQFPNLSAEWAFGAGLQAVTFVSPIDSDHYLEHGLSWYSASRSFALTPGHTNPKGERYRILDPSAAILRCFACHSTGTPTRDPAGHIQPHEPGVQCEACHLPAAAHAASRQPVHNPKTRTAVQVNELCGACHRMPTTSGDNTDWSNPWNARHQPVYLAESACFRKSQGRLSCFTCHPPHAELRHDAAHYNQICRNCHEKPLHRQPVATRTCVECHMPPVRPSPSLRFANHWIGVYTAGKPLRPLTTQP